MREKHVHNDRMMCRLVQQCCKNFKAVRQERAKNKRLKDVTGDRCVRLRCVFGNPLLNNKK